MLGSVVSRDSQRNGGTGSRNPFLSDSDCSEPILEVDSMPHWRRCMQGHSACNIVPVVAANRIGEEKVTPSEANGYQESSLLFYGSSFVTDATGEIVTQASRDKEEIVYGESDLDADADLRVSWGLFRDRRPEIYKVSDKISQLILIARLTGFNIISMVLVLISDSSFCSF